MNEIIRVNEQYYILATSPRVDDTTRVLKEGDTFGVFDRRGDIQPFGLGEQGLYYGGTRFLSRLEFHLGEQRPLLLSSTIRDDNALLSVDLTNPDIACGDGSIIIRGTLHFFRSKLLWKGCCYEHLRITNFGQNPVQIRFGWNFSADFADIFEVRGIKRERRGRFLKEKITADAVSLSYEGLDGKIRMTQIEFNPPPEILTKDSASYTVTIKHREERSFFLTIRCFNPDTEHPEIITYTKALSLTKDALRHARSENCEIFTSNEQFNDWINRSLSDLHMMLTNTPSGPYPYAGVPWFSTFFGRDGIITALEWLWVNPMIAKGVLRFLSQTQSKEFDPERDAEPGRILHEMRKGEMASLNEIPFGKYYGSIDATELFVILASEYYDRTADIDLIKEIWPNIELALNWMDKYGDIDGDGYVEYRSLAKKGLVHQGWKDSIDAVFHEDGQPAEGPIAMVEVQAYMYAAKIGASKLSRLIGNEQLSEQLLHSAQILRENFERDFWSDELSTYILALDGKKRPCKVKASNAGHCLYCGIASPQRALQVARTLLSDEFFSGWAIRTLSSREKRYNPMSYHNGSVWPHDNAIIAAGFSRYGIKRGVIKIFSGLFDANLFFDLHRMPELFCGFPRRPGEGPTLYPIACSPQSWSAASVFLLLQACLGLHIDARHYTVRFINPVLPSFLQEITIKNLRVRDSSVDLVLRRYRDDVGVEILKRDGPLDVIVKK